ncbi:hypothetical protein I551_7585 [Mycobacterium ulcerans str. Harvey]|uniref:Uncharacterized protein n=1 Tax=Mycobacterium ulcerans str. Harvey TaxID=1299332 RepID=A0ABN0QMR9_MYCUL|nr:hypothetical protein I551_7585 [Mycobacterium ulcerans str. Harvey]
MMGKGKARRAEPAVTRRPPSAALGGQKSRAILLITTRHRGLS